jgi:hypothetical protein
LLNSSNRDQVSRKFKNIRVDTYRRDPHLLKVLLHIIVYLISAEKEKMVPKMKQAVLEL